MFLVCVFVSPLSCLYSYYFYSPFYFYFVYSKHSLFLHILHCRHIAVIGVPHTLTLGFLPTPIAVLSYLSLTADRVSLSTKQKQIKKDLRHRHLRVLSSSRHCPLVNLSSCRLVTVANYLSVVSFPPLPSRACQLLPLPGVFPTYSCHRLCRTSAHGATQQLTQLHAAIRIHVFCGLSQAITDLNRPS